MRQQKYDQAESLLLSGFKGMQRRIQSIPLGSRHFVSDSIQRLIDFYIGAGHPDEAVTWKKELEDFASPAEKTPSSDENLPEPNQLAGNAVQTTGTCQRPSTFTNHFRRRLLRGEECPADTASAQESQTLPKSRRTPSQIGPSGPEWAEYGGGYGSLDIESAGRKIAHHIERVAGIRTCEFEIAHKFSALSSHHDEAQAFLLRWRKVLGSDRNNWCRKQWKCRPPKSRLVSHPCQR